MFHLVGWLGEWVGGPGIGLGHIEWSSCWKIWMEPLHCSSYHSSPPHSERGRTKPRRSRWDTSLSISVAEERSFLWCWCAKYSVQTSFYFFVISLLLGRIRYLYWFEQAWGKMAIASVNFSRQIYPHLQLRQACKWVVGILTWACSHPVGGRALPTSL